MSEIKITRHQAEFADTLQAMGLKDSHAEEPHTITVGMGPNTLPSHPQQVVQRLPRLMEDGPLDTPPDLAIIDLLGEGGMGLVELAEQLSLGRKVAVKKVRPDSRSEETTLDLLREGWTTGLLEHPNIVPVHSLGRDAEGEPIIVMKKISGTSWLEIIYDPEKSPSAFRTDDILDLHVEVLIQVCNAIHYAHNQGIIHRDLKPDNVMLGEFGEVYVLDWGIAVALHEDPAGRLASIHDVTMPSGTPVYMAPEMVEGEGDKLGVHTDVFLLGAMLYEALTGSPPYSGATVYQILFQAHLCEPPTFDDKFPRELVEICRRAMAREPSERFLSARALRDALMQYRRNRESHLLADQGESRLQELRSLLATESAEKSVDEIVLYRLFSECRFAFEQARRINPNLLRAEQGLQAVLEAMIDRELDRQGHKAASLLLAELPRKNPILQARLAALEEDLASHKADFETLQRFRFEADVDVGRGSRAFFVLIMGTAWALLSLLFSYIVEVQGVEPTHGRNFAHIVSLTALIAAVIYFGRQRFFENQVNRKIIYAALATFVCVTVHRGIAWIQELPFRTAVAHEMLIYGMATILVAVTLDKRLIGAGIPFIIGAVIGAIWQPSMLWLFGPVNLIGMLILVWFWRPQPAPPSPEKAA